MQKCLRSLTGKRYVLILLRGEAAAAVALAQARNLTCALSPSRLTVQSCTPGNAPNARSRDATQLAHVMPLTTSRAVTRVGGGTDTTTVPVPDDHDDDAHMMHGVDHDAPHVDEIRTLRTDVVHSSQWMHLSEWRCKLRQCMLRIT
jgi:hypothetical protein